MITSKSVLDDNSKDNGVIRYYRKQNGAGWDSLWDGG